MEYEYGTLCVYIGMGVCGLHYQFCIVMYLYNMIDAPKCLCTYTRLRVYLKVHWCLSLMESTFKTWMYTISAYVYMFMT